MASISWAVQIIEESFDFLGHPTKDDKIKLDIYE